MITAEKQQKYEQKVKEMRLMDDTFLSAAFKHDYRCTELVLKIVTEKSDLKVIKVEVQDELKNLRGHSVRLDVYAEDSSGKKYDIEVQRASDGANPRRARYYSSLIDSNILDKNEKYDTLAETYVIFITETDVLGKGLPLYHIDRMVKESGDLFNDEAHIIYVNGAYRDESPIGLLMHDFSCNDPSKMNYKELADVSADLKGENGMCRIMEELIYDEKEESAVKMIEGKKLSFEDIAEYLGLTVEQVEEIAKKHEVLQPA